MSPNLKAKLSEDRFEALALRVQWRHKTAAHHSADQHLCGLRAALPLSLLQLVLGHQLPQSLRILSLNLTAVFQVPAKPDKHITKCQLLISTPENHQLCGSGGVMGHH